VVPNSILLIGFIIVVYCHWRVSCNVTTPFESILNGPSFATLVLAACSLLYLLFVLRNTFTLAKLLPQLCAYCVQSRLRPAYTFMAGALAACRFFQLFVL
jgi:hypothetical protein